MKEPGPRIFDINDIKTRETWLYLVDIRGHYP